MSSKDDLDVELTEKKEDDTNDIKIEEKEDREIEIKEKDEENEENEDKAEEKKKKSSSHLEVDDEKDLEQDDSYNSLFGDDDDIDIDLKAEAGSNEDFDDKKVQQQNLKRIQKRNTKKNTNTGTDSNKKRKRKNADKNKETPQEEEDEADKKPKSTFDLILEENMKKPTRRSNKKILESERANNEEIGRKLIENMEIAFQNDIIALKQKKPALEKLKILPQIEETMRKTYMQDVLLSQQILVIFNKWLQPPKKGVLPSLEIRSKLLELMNNISTSKWDNQHEEIKLSQIGRIIKSFISHPKETHLNKRLAQQLIEKWTRSIVNDSDNENYVATNYPSPTKLDSAVSTKKQKMLQILDKKVKENAPQKPSIYINYGERNPLFFVKGPPPQSKVESSKRKKKDTSINLETTN